jgi:hypothetical protein
MQTEIEKLSTQLLNLIIKQNELDLNLENYNVELQYNIMPKKDGVLFHTIKIKVPEHMISVNRKGEIVIKDTVTPKAKQITKTNKKPAIQIIPQNKNTVEIVDAGSIVDAKTGKPPVVEEKIPTKKIAKKPVVEDIHYKLGKRDKPNQIRQESDEERIIKKIIKKEPINTIEQLEEIHKLVENLVDEVVVDGYVFYDNIHPNRVLLDKIESGIKKKLKKDPLYSETKKLKDTIQVAQDILSEPYRYYTANDALEMAQTMNFLLDENRFRYLCDLRIDKIINKDEKEKIAELSKIKSKCVENEWDPITHQAISRDVKIQRCKNDINLFLKKHT